MLISNAHVLYGIAWICHCCLCHFLLFVDVIIERLKVRREAQEAKRQAEEAKQEAETGSAKTTADGLTSQLDSREHKDTEPKEDASSQGNGQLSIQYSLF